MVYGIRAIEEALDSQKSIEKVYLLRDSRNKSLFSIQQDLKKKGIPISMVPSVRLDQMTKGNHQGIVAMISPIYFHDIEEMLEKVPPGKNPLFLILDRLTDVRNFGAIIRTAECCGVHGIIVQKSGNAPINADTIKTSAGAAFKVPMARVDHIKDAIYHLKASDIKIVAATEKTDQSIYHLNLTEPIAIVMGAEDKGISPSVLKMVDYRAKLPLMGDIGSLNVSVACGAFLYESVRQRITN